MRRFFLLSLLLALFIPATFVFAASDESSRSVITQELATTCNTATYKCYCGTKPSAVALSAPLDSTACQASCATDYSSETQYSITCTNKATPSTTITYVAGPITYVAPPSTAEEKPSPVIPILNVDVGAVFTAPTIINGKTQVNFFATYLNAIYKLLMVSGSIIAVTMIMVAGLQYTLARGNPKGITKAKDRIKNAVIGLVLLMCAYTLAYLIDPSTTSFASLKIESVARVELYEPEEDFDQGGTAGTAYTGGLSTVTGTHINNQTGDDGQIGNEVLTALNSAATAYYNNYRSSLGITGIRVTSASRTTNKQASLFYDNCLANGGICNPGTCDPTGSGYTNGSTTINRSSSKPRVFTLKGALIGLTANATNRGTILSALIADSKTSNCPHTSNVAVDIWPESGHSGSFCASVVEMDALAKTMTDPAYGFCRLDSEAWHFELDKVKVDKTSCRPTNTNSHTTGTNNPDSTCSIWDYKNHCCHIATDPKNKPTTMCPTTTCG